MAMAKVQYASAGMNLTLSEIAEPRKNSLHLYEKSLCLASAGVGGVNVGPGHVGADTGHDIAKRGVEDDPVDGPVEVLREAERKDDGEAADKGQDGAYSRDQSDGFEMCGSNPPRLGQVHCRIWLV